MVEIAQAIGPKVFITTGTGGGIGAAVALGDVVMAGRSRFDCVTQFKNKNWHNASYATSSLPAGAIEAITPDLTRVNASRIQGARSVPRIWASEDDTVVTTDFFGFDDSTDYYHLEGSGARVCDMGDAMVGDAMRDCPGVKWYSVRNASDPQIPNLSKNIAEAKREAGEIYAKYGAFTTAASVIATWAIIDAAFRGGPGSMVMAKGKSHKSLSRSSARAAGTTDPLAELSVRRASQHGGYGWIRDLPDARDFIYGALLSVSLKDCPPPLT